MSPQETKMLIFALSDLIWFYIRNKSCPCLLVDSSASQHFKILKAWLQISSALTDHFPPLLFFSFMRKSSIRYNPVKVCEKMFWKLRKPYCSELFLIKIQKVSLTKLFLSWKISGTEENDLVTFHLLKGKHELVFIS